MTYSDDIQVFTSIIGIELRGGFSQSFPKKTYDLEFWTDVNGNGTQNFQIGNMRNDDDWVLDALYNEPLRNRTYLSHKLWLDIHTPHYLANQPNAKSGADVMYVEMFLNNQYNGVYLFSEQIDKKLLQLKKYTAGTIKGELFKAYSWGQAVTYSSLQNYNNNSRTWSGFQQKYPKASQATEWANLHSFVGFVINSTDADFISQVWNKFDKSNAIDYFLFLNIMRATDNTGKNIYVARYKTTGKYFNSPWDLDGSFGLRWDGNLNPTTTGILSNGFYNRLLSLSPAVFYNDLRDRWISIRSNIISNVNIQNKINHPYNILDDNNVYERETLIFPNYPYDQTARDYISDWTVDRIQWLDDYFSVVIDPQNCGIGSVTFVNQADVDNFVNTYSASGCTKINGSLTVQDTSTDLSGLSFITEIETYLTIENSSLTNLNGLSNISLIGGAVAINNNASLTDINGLSIDTVLGIFNITNNASLIDIDVLDNIIYIERSLTVSNNSLLDDCCVLTSFLEGDSYVGDSITITNNNTNCISIPVVISSCAISQNDEDTDTIIDSEDNCINFANQNQEDTDNDGIGDICDNCPEIANPLQEDANNNGIGDACEADGSGSDTGTDDGGIGIGTTNPKSQLDIKQGDVFIGNIHRGVIMKTPSGKCFRFQPNEEGNLIGKEIACPDDN